MRRGGRSTNHLLRKQISVSFASTFAHPDLRMAKRRRASSPDQTSLMSTDSALTRTFSVVSRPDKTGSAGPSTDHLVHIRSSDPGELGQPGCNSQASCCKIAHFAVVPFLRAIIRSFLPLQDLALNPRWPQTSWERPPTSVRKRLDTKD